MPTTPLFRGGIFYLIITSDIMTKTKKRAHKRAFNNIVRKYLKLRALDTKRRMAQLHEARNRRVKWELEF
jgi:hypothetical protein